MKKRKMHDEKWFEAQEARIAEPIANTVRYYRKPFYVSIIVYLCVLFVTLDYYGTFQGFMRMHEWLAPTSTMLFCGLAFGLFFLWGGLRAGFLLAMVGKMKQEEPYKLQATWYHVFSIPLFGLLAFTPTAEFTIWAIVNAALYLIRIVLFVILKDYVSSGFECQYCLQKFEEQRANYLGKGRSVTFVGAPGSGKSVTGGTVSITVAEQRWEKLKFDYFTENARSDYYMKTANVEKLKRLQSLRESYEFYAERESEYIPCLATSIGMQDLSGRYSYTLTSEVYAQIKRVPEYTVLFNDESGREQGCQTSRSATNDVLDFWRLNRHFGDFILINTEQGADGNGKYIRKCTDYNIRCYWQEWMLAPRRAQARFEKHKMKFYELRAEGKLTEAEEKYRLQELYYEAKYIATIGFRKIKTRKEGTPEQGALQIDGGDEYIIIPSRTIYNYDERAYAELYQCADEPIELAYWTSLTLTNIVEDDKKTDVITNNE